MFPTPSASDTAKLLQELMQINTKLDIHLAATAQWNKVPTEDTPHALPPPSLVFSTRELWLVRSSLIAIIDQGTRILLDHLHDRPNPGLEEKPNAEETKS